MSDGKGALRLMGRFIISHYQLIPLDRPGPAGAHQEYVKEKKADWGKMGASQMKREMEKDTGLAESGALGQNKKLCGGNRKRF